MNANKEQAKPSASEAETKQNSNANRKEQKRLEAEFRKAIQPLKKSIEKLEKQLDKLTEQADEIEQALADNSLYTDENKAKLSDLLARQAKITPELNDTEENLLMALEELEEKQNHFDETGEIC